MSEYSAAYAEACRNWVEEVVGLGGRFKNPPRIPSNAPATHFDNRMRLTLADMRLQESPCP
jgi:hypothetical protein